MENNFDCFRLQNGLEIPCLAYGTYQAAETQDCQTLRLAIEAGYRYFDTASFYHTETFVAQAIRDSGLPREEFFLTSKAWKTEMGVPCGKSCFSKIAGKPQHRIFGSLFDPLALAFPRL